jgi:hypothetical protein
MSHTTQAENKSQANLDKGQTSEKEHPIKVNFIGVEMPT